MMYINSARKMHRISINNQSGMSLIEVMIAMTIGLIVLIALGYFFLSSTQISRTTDDVSRMQESGRNALELMGRSIRQAGYRINVDEKFGGTNKLSVNYNAKVITGTNGAGTVPDSITIKYNAQEGGDVNCTGATVAQGTSTAPNIVTAAFTVVGGALTCNGTVVVENIEDMQISYGIDGSASSAKDGAIDKVGGEAYISNPTPEQFNYVAVVQVNLLTRGPSANVTTNDQAFSYNGATVITDDGHLRQVYSATFTVRNQAW